MTARLRLRIGTYAANTQQPPHAHTELHLSLILQGGVAETVGAVTEYAGALAIVAKDAGVVHANQFGRDGARVAQLSLPWGTLGQLAETGASDDGWRWTQDPSVARPFLRLIRRAQGSVPSFDVADGDVVDLVAASTALRTADARGAVGVSPGRLRALVKSV
jgi:hypothetical protein